MFILRLIKSPKFFYTLMAVLFFIFVLIILFTGRNIYVSEKNKLHESKLNELVITKQYFENRLDEVKIEIRRIVNMMRQMDMLADPNEVTIKALISDFLFDHHYLSVIIHDNQSDRIFRLNSDSFTDTNNKFTNMPANEILTTIYTENTETNKLVINAELNTVYLVKDLHDTIGFKDKVIIFFFSPELLLKHLQPNYAFLHKDQGVLWKPQNGFFPTDFSLTDKSAEEFKNINDTQAAFFIPLSNINSDFLLAEVIDTSNIKTSLLYSTIITIIVSSLFFILIFILIFFRNLQISQLIDTQKATVVCLANLAEFKDNETADHLERTRHYGTLLSKELRSLTKYKDHISKDYLDNIGFASVLHDIGKVGVPDEILKKPAKLSDEEFEIIKQHTVFAKEILKELVEKHKINDIFFSLSYNIAAYHHEKWDGSGYPEGLKGEEIPLEARIFALCDVYDALRSERVYKKAFSHEESMNIIKEGRGTHFDPDILDMFLKCAGQFKQIHDTYILFYSQIAYSSFGDNKHELKFDWDNKLSVGIEAIDEHHKALLNKINFLIKSILDGKGDENILSILTFLQDYLEDHFILEETLMLEQNHPDLKAHIEEHNIFRENFMGIIDQVNREGIKDDTLANIESNLITWLLNHIVEMDANLNTETA